ncbi:hypothetical protein NP233_g6376 [Leucocoprinus birnbaumii]|uniref:Nephrocystin 3-like N-terminal domain-containing protein n=1 Tax=Leucocoprinus birnbaumii TaxID=56174 RepID=A0AAD5VR53_9AGAR|nr:hypothetical protein NP233_g6376 [Leucocoprinus birnbaumii]
MLLETVQHVVEKLRLLAGLVEEDPPLPQPRSQTEAAPTANDPPPLGDGSMSIVDANAPSDMDVSTPDDEGSVDMMGAFRNARDFTIDKATFISIMQTRGVGLELLLEKRMAGAEVDSYARRYAPRCHPDTRLTVLGHILDWIHGKRDCGWRMLWIMGPAGVGKSAVAQSIAEKIKVQGQLGASLFFSRPDHRDDPMQIIPTLAYQLAVKVPQYKSIVTRQLAEDPTLFEKSLRTQFKQVIIDPFHLIMTRYPSILRKPLLIILDGLDECKCQKSQCELVELLSDHARAFKIFPLLWLVCSRPEWHLKYFRSQADFPAACTRLELKIDDSEAQRDVACFLRFEFLQMCKRFPDYIVSPWPPEATLRLIASIASGLFALAATLVRFIGDEHAEDPCRRLKICIQFLGGYGTPGSINPLHALDLLYHQICTTIPSDALATTKQVLGLSIWYPRMPDASKLSARGVAAFLNLNKRDFYRSLNQLHSVLDIPSPSDADLAHLEFHHASFQDYLKDRYRSREFAIDALGVHWVVASNGVQRQNDQLSPSSEALVSWSINSRDRVEELISSLRVYARYVTLEACPKLEGDDAFSIAGMLETFNFRDLDRYYEDKLPEFVLWIYSLVRSSGLRISLP